MRRRELLRVLGGAAAASWPLAVRAQQAGRMRHVAVLMSFAETDTEGRGWIAAFERGLNDFGWSTGRNIRFSYRFGGGVLERIQKFATELVDLQPDVLFAGSTPAVIALMRETRAIPIIFTNLSDPIDTGLVPSLARPGGNVTGFTAFEYSLSGKWLEILKTAAPDITRVALLFDPKTAPYAPNYVSSLRSTGSALGLDVSAAPVGDVSEIESAFIVQARGPGGSIIVMPTAFANVHRASIISSAARYRVPAIYPFRIMAREGGLVFYGASTVDLYRRAASYVDRILRGENPGELPVQQPIKFELVINLKTAKTLGLQVPLSLQQLADEVIE